MWTDYAPCCDRLWADCFCEGEVLPFCHECGERIPAGDEVERDGQPLCRACNHEVRDEEVTRVGA